MSCAASGLHRAKLRRLHCTAGPIAHIHDDHSAPPIYPVNHGWLRLRMSWRQSLDPVHNLSTHGPLYMIDTACKQNKPPADSRKKTTTSDPQTNQPIMASSPALLLLLLAAAAAAAPQLGSAVDPVGTYCAKNFTGAQTQASIAQVLASLVPRASAAYYATATAGSGGSAIWGLAQCRGDIPASDCALCVSAAAKQASSSCRGQADVRLWYDYCFLRYSDSDFIGLPDTGYALILINTANASDPVAFDRAERKLMARVAAEAGNSATGGLVRETARFGEATTIYGLGWCTKDIAAADCGLCVAQAVAELPNYCQFRRGCRVLYSSCMARYETYPFFFPVSGAAAASSHAGEYEKVILNHHT